RSKRDWSSDVCSSDLTSYLQPSLNGDQPPFFHIVGDRFRKLSPDNDIDKVGLPLAPLVGERTIHRQSKAGDGDTIGGVTKLGIQIGRASCRERGESRG